MRDANRLRGLPIVELRATLARLGFGKKTTGSDNAEQWTARAGRLSVTIHTTKAGLPAALAPHIIGNLRVFELPPGATVDEKPVRLSRTEFSILLGLARAQQEFVQLDELSRFVREGRGISLGALAVHVYGLRRKLAVNRANVTLITKRTLGYKLAAGCGADLYGRPQRALARTFKPAFGQDAVS